MKITKTRIYFAHNNSFAEGELLVHFPYIEGVSTNLIEKPATIDYVQNALLQLSDSTTVLTANMEGIDKEIYTLLTKIHMDIFPLKGVYMNFNSELQIPEPIIKPSNDFDAFYDIQIELNCKMPERFAASSGLMSMPKEIYNPSEIKNGENLYWPLKDWLGL